jgi:hypothetical protein
MLASALPLHWWDIVPGARLMWVAALGFFLVGALLPGQGKSTDLAVRRRRLLFQAAVLWMIAPFAGPVGVLLFRIPVLQLGLLALVQRWHLVRAASQFPADVN